MPSTRIRAVCRRLVLASSVVAMTAQLSLAQDASSEARLLNQKVRLLEVLLERAKSKPNLSADDRATLEVAETLIHVAHQDLRSADLQEINTSLDESLRLIGEVSRQYAKKSAVIERDEYEALRSTVRGLYLSLIHI